MRPALIVALGILVLCATARIAHAYPQFQLSTGADTCAACHFSPAGGGLLNDYGRDKAGDTISGGGDGRFLHGLWTPPSWLALGADLRAAAGLKDGIDLVYPLAFPMQADVYARAAAGGFSFNLIVGARQAARPPRPAFAETLASREHYVMYQRATWSVRAGRFFPVFGVRTQDHTAYVRNFLDLGLYQEPYGLEGAWLGASSELHASFFGPQLHPILGAAPRDHGGTIYYERRVHDGAAAWAAQARVLVGPDERRVMAGGVGKVWLDGSKVMLLGELDAGAQTFPHGGPARAQVAGYAGASWLAKPGWMFGGALHLWEPDVALRGSTREAAELDAQWFPRAHLEAHLLTRVETQAVDLGRLQLLALLQLHYYL